MLDELRDLFLAALKFEGNDAMPLVNRWNEAVKRVQAVFDNMTSKTVDAAPVCRCKDCKFGTNDPTGIVICRMASYPNYATRNQNWYCAEQRFDMNTDGSVNIVMCGCEPPKGDGQ